MSSRNRNNYIRKIFPWVASLVLLALLLLCTACPSRQNEQAGSAARKYMSTTDTLPFSFSIPTESKLLLAEAPQQERVFADVVFPAEKARLYCTYHVITPEEFSTSAEESRKLVYFHSTKAEAIEEDFYENPAGRVYGILYTLKGNVATPVQFSLTDSISYFFHASLYFDEGESKPEKGDTLRILNTDLKKLMETFQNSHYSSH